jgi:hypothetical protein
MKRQFEQSEFKNWLETRFSGSDMIVGHAGKCMLCPIACWLAEKTNGKRVSVSRSRIYVDGKRKAVPKWVTQFVYNADKQPNYLISQQVAMEILSQL